MRIAVLYVIDTPIRLIRPCNRYSRSIMFFLFLEKVKNTDTCCSLSMIRQPSTSPILTLTRVFLSLCSLHTRARQGIGAQASCRQRLDSPMSLSPSLPPPLPPPAGLASDCTSLAAAAAGWTSLAAAASLSRSPSGEVASANWFAALSTPNPSHRLNSVAVAGHHSPASKFIWRILLLFS